MEFIKFRYDAGSGVENATPADHGGLHAREHLEQSSLCRKSYFFITKPEWYSMIEMLRNLCMP
jgi:hypothetical protein